MQISYKCANDDFATEDAGGTTCSISLLVQRTWLGVWLS
jgi:hypothetical protein